MLQLQVFVSIACWATIFCGLPLLQCRADDNATEVLLAARQHWVSSLGFKSTYVYREGITATYAAALGDTPFDEIKTTGNGVFHKKGGLIRRSIAFEGGPFTDNEKTLDQNGRSNTDSKPISTRPGQKQPERIRIRNTPLDEVSNGNLFVVYHQKWKENFFDTALFTNRIDIEAIAEGHGCTPGEMLISPINPMGGCSNGMPGELSAASGPINYQTLHQDDGRIIVTAELHTTMANVNVGEFYRAEWDMESACPTLKRVVYKFEGGGRTHTSECLLSDFRSCGENSIPASVRIIFTQPDSPILVREWYSEDLGSEEPVDDDFVIQIPETTRIMGLKNPEPEGTIRHLDLSSTAIDSVILAGRHEKVAELARPTLKRIPDVDSTSGRLLILVNVGIAALVIIILFRRRVSQ